MITAKEAKKMYEHSVICNSLLEEIKNKIIKIATDIEKPATQLDVTIFFKQYPKDMITRVLEFLTLQGFILNMFAYSCDNTSMSVRISW